MNGNNLGTPDLQAILATLSQFTSPAQGVQTSSNGPAQEHAATFTPIDQSIHAAPALPAETVSDPRLRPQSRSAAASPKPIDPATITTWQDGLRCVTKIAAQNSQFSASIRRIMDNQRKHELQWYSERQALKQAQANQSTASAKAQSILQSLNSVAVSEPGAADTEVAKQAELSTFDRKIYAAQVSMEEVMIGELKSLGVPFFGTDESLVVPDASEKQVVETRPKWSAVVTKSELMMLRRKMVGHLEDLYRD